MASPGADWWRRRNEGAEEEGEGGEGREKRGGGGLEVRVEADGSVYATLGRYWFLPPHDPSVKKGYRKERISR